MKLQKEKKIKWKMSNSKTFEHFMQIVLYSKRLETKFSYSFHLNASFHENRLFFAWNAKVNMIHPVRYIIRFELARLRKMYLEFFTAVSLLTNLATRTFYSFSYILENVIIYININKRASFGRLVIRQGTFI